MTRVLLFFDCGTMANDGPNARVVEQWQTAAKDLGIRVTAPAELRDAAGNAFLCEALVHDFGSPAGAIFVSQKTERRVRPFLHGMSETPWVCVAAERASAAYVRKHFIDNLQDCGWFGPAGAEPDWYRQ